MVFLILVYHGGFNGWEKLLGDDVLEIPPSSLTMEMDDEKTSNEWQARLEKIKEREFMTDAFSMMVIRNSNMHGS